VKKWRRRGSFVELSRRGRDLKIIYKTFETTVKIKIIPSKKIEVFFPRVKVIKKRTCAKAFKALSLNFEVDFTKSPFVRLYQLGI